MSTLSEKIAEAEHFEGLFDTLLSEVEDDESYQLVMSNFAYWADECYRLLELERQCN